MIAKTDNLRNKVLAIFRECGKIEAIKYLRYQEGFRNVGLVKIKDLVEGLCEGRAVWAEDTGRWESELSDAAELTYLRTIVAKCFMYDDRKKRLAFDREGFKSLTGEEVGVVSEVTKTRNGWD